MMGPILGAPPFPRILSDVVYSNDQSPDNLEFLFVNGLTVGLNFSSCEKSPSISSTCAFVAVRPLCVSDARERICSLSLDLREESHLSFATTNGIPIGRYSPKNRCLAVVDDDDDACCDAAFVVGGEENACACCEQRQIAAAMRTTTRSDIVIVEELLLVG